MERPDMFEELPRCLRSVQPQGTGNERGGIMRRPGMGAINPDGLTGYEDDRPATTRGSATSKRRGSPTDEEVAEYDAGEEYQRSITQAEDAENASMQGDEEPEPYVCKRVNGGDFYFTDPDTCTNCGQQHHREMARKEDL